MKYLLIVLVSCTTLGSQLLLKKVIVTLGPLLQQDKIGFVLNALISPYVILAIVIQGCGFIIWMFVLSTMKLGIAFGISGATFYVLVALSSWFLYGERLTFQQWGGLLLISSGVLLMTLTKS